MIEITDLTYYQKNRGLILNKKKINMKIIKRDSESRQEINTESYLKNKKIKKWNTERIDFTICLKKRNKD